MTLKKNNFFLLLPAYRAASALLLLLFMHFNSLQAQDFVGFNTHPYSGVSGIDVNPASIGGTVYKADVALGGASLVGNNNYIKFNPKFISKWDYQKNGQSLELNTAGVATDVYLHGRVQLPSAMYDINNNDAVALTLQVRTYVQAENVGREFAKLLYEDFSYTPYWNNTYSANGLKLRMLSWGEIGAGYAHVFYLNGGHRFKVGTRLKYLMGLNALYLNMGNTDYLFQNDHVIDVNGSAEYAHSDNLGEKIGFKPSGSGFGFDLGVKYSYDNQFILGLSLLDIGSIKFDRAATANNFTISQQNWDLNNENVGNIAQFDSLLALRGTPTASPDQFTIGLPATLSVQGTFNLWKSGDFEGGGYQNLYLNVTSYFDLSSINNGKDATMRPLPLTTATLGFVSIPIGAGIPITFGGKTDFQAGMFLRLGPFVMGSRNLITYLAAKQVRDFDAYAAIKVPLLKPKPHLVQGCPKHF